MKTQKQVPIEKTLGWGLRVYRLLFKEYMRRVYQVNRERKTCSVGG